MPKVAETNPAKTLGHSLLGYVPRIASDFLLEADKPLDQPHQELCECAVFFADISGFTALTERLAERGPEGVETLTGILNDYFGRLVDAIEAQGGDVVKFAGDALLAIWPTSDKQSLRDAVRVATQCALSVQGTLKDYRAADGERLSMKVAIGAGAVQAFHIGGVFGRWEFAIAGDPVSQVEAVNAACEPGDVGISSAAMAIVADTLRCAPLNSRCHRIDAALGQVDVPDVLRRTVAESQIKQLKSHIPAAIHQRLEAGQSVWLAELRRITVLFVNLPTLTDNTPIQEANRAMRTLQTALYSQEGSMNKLSVDDKGVSLIGALGLPPLSHNDDPVRGVLAALTIQSDLQALGWQCSIGVTTGRVFCGTIGNDRRREYTIMGDTVNLSARLMQAADGGILCDQATYAQAQHMVRFTELEPVSVKGKFNQISVFDPIERIETEGDEAADMGFVGRSSERAALVEAFAQLRAGDGAAAVVEGAPGVGKTRFAAELVRAAQANDIRVVRSSAAHAQRTTPYFAWAFIFQQLLCITSSDSTAEAEQKLLRQVASVEELVWLAPLFNSILPVELAPTTLTAQMDSEARRDALLNLSINLLRHLSVKRPVISLLEDGQWLDDASWLLLERVAKEVRWMLPIVITRPLNPPLPAGYVQLGERDSTVTITLAPLNREETIALAKERLGVRAMKVDLADLIHMRTQGNPFFLEAFLDSLTASSGLEITDGAARLADSEADAKLLPDSLESLVMERLDRLPPSIQLTLKVASVIGERFDARVLRAVYPVPEERHLVDEHIHELRDLGLLQEIEGEDAFGFRNATVRDVTYNLMLFSQRRQLHAAIAEWLEQTYDGQTSRYALMAHHFDNAKDNQKTIKYCALAGENASASFGNREAVAFYARALEVDAEEQRSDRYQRAQWEEALGNAYYAQGDFDLSLLHLEQALLVYDRALPKTRGALYYGIASETLRQFVSTIFGSRSAKTLHVQLAGAARIYTRLGQLHYLNNDKLKGVYTALRGLNLAVRSGSTLEMSRHFANMTIVAGLARLHRLAERYYQLATRSADQANDDGARAYVLNIVGLYRVTQGQWGAVEQCLMPAQDLALRIGHHRRWEETAVVLVSTHFRRGELRAAHKLARLLYQSGRRRSVASVQIWGLTTQILAELALAVDASATAEKLAPLLTEKIPRGDQILAHGVLAKVAHVGGDNDQAWNHARAARALMIDTDTTAQYVLEGYAGVAEFAHALLAADPDNIEAQELSKLAVNALAVFAKLYPVGQPRYHLCLGQQLWHAGQKQQALKTWHAGLEHAETLKMIYEVSQLHSHLADFGANEDVAKRHYVVARTFENQARAAEDENDELDKVTKSILWI